MKTRSALDGAHQQALARNHQEIVPEHVLFAIRRPESSMFHSVEPAPERWFVAELRQKVLAELKPSAAEFAIELEKLRTLGVPVRYDVYEDEGHGFTKRANELKAVQDTAEFLEQHLLRR